MPNPRTLYDKPIDSHTVRKLDDRGHILLCIDRQVLNEYTSPQAFSGLRERRRKVWRPNTALAVVDVLHKRQGIEHVVTQLKSEVDKWAPIIKKAGVYAE